MSDNKPLPEVNSNALVVQHQKITQALNSYARQLTFENRSRRNLYRISGLSPRLRDKVFTALLTLNFIFVLLVPAISVFYYYVFAASPQYKSEVRFVLRSAAPFVSKDPNSKNTTKAESKIIQDTQIVVSYFTSPAILTELSKQFSFPDIFGRDDIDFVSRLPDDASREETLEFWNDQQTSKISPKSGIVELNVWAFTPEDSKTLITQVMKLAEKRVNALNEGVWGSLLSATQNELTDATQNLKILRTELSQFQNTIGIFDLNLTAEGLADVITDLELELASLKSKHDALSTVVDGDSVVLRNLEREMEARKIQIEEMNSRNAGKKQNLGPNLAENSVKFTQLNFEINIAEKRFREAVKEYEKARLVSSMQLVYLDMFASPTLPQESTYPKLLIALPIGLLVIVLIWGATSAAILYVREKID